MDHPRLRGEKWSSCFFWVMSLGSPPLARGKVVPGVQVDGVPVDHPRLRGEKLPLWLPPQFLPRITPACAGKSPMHSGRRRNTSDHPRLRGEKSSALEKSQTALGSPPLARGKATSASTSPAPPSDHPRLRGEKNERMAILSREEGSPPLARGKVFDEYMEKYKLRITPACAGKSSTPPGIFRGMRDHPRLRGEKTLTLTMMDWELGPPPLARGKVGPW